MSQRCVRARVFGLVQGVGFRYFTQREASRLGLVGRASNLADGSVEVLAAGEAEQVASLLSWLDSGPRTASVERVQLEELAELDRDYDGFFAH